jgi:hypothetical protein
MHRRTGTPPYPCGTFLVRTLVPPRSLASVHQCILVWWMAHLGGWDTNALAAAATPIRTPSHLKPRDRWSPTTTGRARLPGLTRGGHGGLAWRNGERTLWIVIKCCPEDCTTVVVDDDRPYMATRDVRHRQGKGARGWCFKPHASGQHVKADQTQRWWQSVEMPRLLAAAWTWLHDRSPVAVSATSTYPIAGVLVDSRIVQIVSRWWLDVECTSDGYQQVQCIKWHNNIF